MNTKAKGDISELAIASALAKKGFSVLFPYGDNNRYDLVFEEDGKFNRVQCKTARTVAGVAGICTFDTCSIDIITGKKEDYLGQIDYYGVYFPDRDECYLLSIEEVPNKVACRLRFEEPISNQSSKIRYTKDYLIQWRVAKVGKASVLQAED